jgi:DNA polymerase-3 subunit gamma/tau
MLSTSAFNALLKTLEEPPAHGLFILATTEIHKVPATIISRCQRFDFRRIPAASLVKRLAAITKEEGVSVSADVLAEVARHADGCARDAESLLGQILSLGEKKITMDEASLVLPATTDVLVVDFVESLLLKKTAEAVRLVNGYVEQGVDMAHFVDDVIDVLRALLFAKLGGEESRMEKLEEKARERLKAALGGASPVWITRTIEMFLEARRAVKTDKIPQLGVEIAIVKVCEPDFQHREADLSLRAKRSNPSNVILSKAKDLRGDSSPASGGVRMTNEAPVEVKATVFESIPVVSLDEVKTKWPEVFQQIKECHATLPIVMQAGEIAVVEGDAVEFSFQYALHADTINQARNRQLLEETLSRVLGKRVRVRAKYAHADADETVSNLLQKFGGSVV